MSDSARIIYPPNSNRKLEKKKVQGKKVQGKNGIFSRCRLGQGYFPEKEISVIIVHRVRLSLFTKGNAMLKKLAVGLQAVCMCVVVGFFATEMMNNASGASLLLSEVKKCRNSIFRSSCVL